MIIASNFGQIWYRCNIPFPGILTRYGWIISVFQHDDVIFVYIVQTLPPPTPTKLIPCIAYINIFFILLETRPTFVPTDTKELPLTNSNADGPAVKLQSNGQSISLKEIIIIVLPSLAGLILIVFIILIICKRRYVYWNQ